MTDPLIYHGSAKAKWIVEFFNHVKIARDKMSDIRLPVLIFHGTGDRLVPISASEFINDNVGTADSDKTFEVSYIEKIYLTVTYIALDLCTTVNNAHLFSFTTTTKVCYSFMS